MKNITYTEFKDFFMIKKEPKRKYEYNCLMATLDVDKELWSQFTSNIDENDLYTEIGNSRYGIENENHVTILYGIHQEEDPLKVVNFAESLTEFTVTIGELSLFENKLFDVLKFDINDSRLTQLNSQLRELVEYTSTYPDYHAHMTVAYLKPGMGKKYLDLVANFDKTILIKEMEYSVVNGSKIFIQLQKDGKDI